MSDMQKRYSGAHKHVKREGYEKELIFSKIK